VTRNLIFTQFKENLHIRLKNTHRDKASHTKRPTATKTKEIIPKENLADFNSSRKAASDVETPMINQRIARQECKMQALWQDWPLRESVHAKTPPKGSPDRE